MHITIPRAALAQATGLVQRIVERRNTIPILSNLALIAEDGTLTIVATDLDIEARTTVQATIVRSGRITVPAHMFADVAGKLPDGLVTIDDGKADGRLVVSAGRSRFQLQTLPFDDFPPMTAEDLPTRFELPKADLERMFGRTQMAVSTEEVRYYLNGVFLHAPPGVDPPVLRAVATDGHRLARLDAPLPAGAAGMPGIIVPRKTVGEVLRLAKAPGDTIAVELSDAKIRITFGTTIITSKLIDGTFP
ncbi:DNA polymerase III subunit beta, partial [Mongoliimonas terrestris]|uniref:DNA polymerase III subunit beta n=1 Tax=Mongoliimonas terrestris TaxID=1709001 RepID=UPI0009495DCC